VIVRILEEGQFDVPDDHLKELERLDQVMFEAVKAHDADALSSALDEALASVRSTGKPVPADFLGPSQLVLPPQGSSVEEVHRLLHEEGLIAD